MHIQFLGLSSFKYTTKDAVVITDPTGKESGLTPPRGNVDIVILAEPENPIYSGNQSLSGEPFLIPHPGEYDIKGVTITGIPLKQEKGYITTFLIESEELKVLSLSHIGEFSMKEDELEDLGEIDILILPVGGNSVLSASAAAKVVNQIEPKIVIPSHYQQDGIQLPLDPLERFIKEMGGKAETIEKLIVKKKDLASIETTKVIIISA